jgi:lysophospholipase L1-like esterase
MPAFFKRLFAVAFGILLFWGAAELGCRLVFAQVISFDIEMWRYAKLVKVVDPASGLRFEHRPNVRASLMGVDVVINSDGLRDRNRSREKAVGVVRIAVVGDSITLGWGVPEEQTYPRRLEVELNQHRPLGPEVTFEVINFGVGNYGISDVADMVEHKALSYRPDMVLYGAFVNDAEVPVDMQDGDSLLRHSQFAVWLWGRIDLLFRQLGWRADYRDYYLGLYQPGTDGTVTVETALDRMQRLCLANKIPLVVLMLPELHDGSKETFAPIRQFYQQAVANAGAGFLDLQDALPDRALRRYWVSADDGHPNSAANLLYAQDIVAGLPGKSLWHGTPAREDAVP